MELLSALKQAKYTVIFTGAGMSTESGLPDFRSQQGLWKSRFIYRTRIFINSVTSKSIPFNRERKWR